MREVARSHVLGWKSCESLQVPAGRPLPVSPIVNSREDDGCHISCSLSVRSQQWAVCCRGQEKMATPYVPVPMPIGTSASSFPASRNQRSSSFGSISASSHSSKGQLEDSDAGTLKQTREPAQADGTSSVSSSPLVRTKFTEADSSVEYSTRPREREEHGPDAASLEARPSTPTILGYEVMEERAKFTVYKILVKKTREESWVVFRRYTDFARLNEKLKEMFPGFRLSLPPKRWFKDNYNADFLEDRQLGLQAFLQNLVAHKDIAHCLAVREFLCLDDPPGPFDSLEESRAFCETLEETNYRLQKELLEKQKELESLRKALGEQQVHIDVLQGRLRALCSEPEESPCLSGMEGQRVRTGKSSALDLDREASDGESSAHDKPRCSLSGPETCASELEVAEVAHSAEEDGAS